TIFATLTGHSMSSVALMGSVMTPEMEKRGYKKEMSLGPILGSGGLAMMIPPSGLGVLLGALAQISIGKILIGIIIPGILMAILYTAYIIFRCKLQPSIAPVYMAPQISLVDKIMSTIRHILPVGIILFLVVGVIFIGVATPTEAAATGAIGVFALAAAWGKLNRSVLKKSITGTISITVMIFMILVAAKAFSQILIFSGATEGLINVILGFSVSPIFILIGMQLIIFALGAFMENLSIMMLTLPLFIPIVRALGFNEIWFAVIYMLNMEMASTTPPFGLTLFAMKGVAPPDTTMGDLYKAGLPFLGCDLIALVLIIAFPVIALWLPGISV
ncbi:TRAP transporter large permease subunit, partial [Chloroflexota bacterium]